MKKDNIIDVITDLDFNIPKKELNNPEIRYAARGIVINENGEIAVINKQIKNEYKLPGGGIENQESPEETFVREIFEETGCQVEISDYLGIVIEEKGQTNFKQISYIFVAKVLNDTKELHLTKKESDEKTILLWKEICEAYELIKNCKENLVASSYDTKYQSLFMVIRDEKILNYYIKINNKKEKRLDK